MPVTSFGLLLLTPVVCAQITGPFYHDDVGIPTADALWKSEVSYQLWRATHSVRIVGGIPSIMGEHPYFSFTGILPASSSLYLSYFKKGGDSKGNIHPIALTVSLNLLLEGQCGQVTGFGATGDRIGITLTQSLRDVYVRLVNKTECASVYGSVVYEGTLCASGQCSRGPCSGDSGGPIAARSSRHPVLIGIVSFGSARGCEVGYPSGFTRVPYFLSWIQERL